MPKRRRSDSYQHQLEREARQSAAEAELMGDMREGAPGHLTGNERRNFLCPVIRLFRGSTRLVRNMIRVAASAPDVDGTDPTTIASMTNKLVVLGAWLVRGEDAFAELSDRTRKSYRHPVGLVQAEWEAERKSRPSPTGVRWSRGTERDNEIVQLVVALSGGSVPEGKRPYRYVCFLEEVSKRQATAATVTENLRGGAPDHLGGDDRRNYLSPGVRLNRETARLVRRMILLAAGAQYGYRGDRQTAAAMANLLLITGGWLVFRDEAFDATPPGTRENCIKQAESLRALRLLEADPLSECSTAGNQAIPVAGQVAASAPAVGSAPTAPPVRAKRGAEAVRLWASELGIETEWSDRGMGYDSEKQVLNLLTLRNEADQVAAILIAMASAAPSIQGLSGDGCADAANLAAGGFAARFGIQETLATRFERVKWKSPSYHTELRAPVHEAVNWLWAGFRDLPARAFMDLLGSDALSAPRRSGDGHLVAARKQPARRGPQSS